MIQQVGASLNAILYPEPRCSKDNVFIWVVEFDSNYVVCEVGRTPFNGRRRLAFTEILFSFLMESS